MTYETALRLEQGGFPYIEGKEYRNVPPLVVNALIVRDVPLEELIKACGENFYYLIRVANGFTARQNPSSEGLSGNAENPREAVALLWLAVNGK